jgi:hypothetical protein
MLRPKIPSLFEPAPNAAPDPTFAGDFSADEHPIARAIERVDKVGALAMANPPSASGRVLPPLEPRAGTAILKSDSTAEDRRPDLEPGAAHDDPVTSADLPRRAAARPRTRTLPDLSMPATKVAPAAKEASTAIRPASFVARGLMSPPRHVQPVDVAEHTDALRTQAPTSGTRTAIDSREGALEAVRAPAPEVSGILQAPVVARIASTPLFSAPRTPESEPTIHVTIGRVEVRAIASPASDSARRERAPSPVMSLDEYLRTRAR